MDDRNDLVAKMKALSDAYAAQLPEKLAQLEHAWSQLRKGQWDDEKLQTIHRMVHSLTGSGKTFGFSQLSNLARTLEDDIKVIARAKSVPNDSQYGHIDSAIAELRQVTIVRDSKYDEQAGRTASLVTKPMYGDIRQIYLVEDDVAQAEDLKNQLSYFEYQVSVFNSLNEFRDAIQGVTDVIVIMDISFPEDRLGGVHIMQEVQQGRKQPLPVIFHSANDDPEARLGAVRAGGVAFVNKSLNISNLIDKLDALTSMQPNASFRVMVVDDSPALTSHYSAVLEDAGMTTKTANDPMAALRTLTEFQPDLILTDMYMPGCNGMDLAKIIRQIDAFVSIPIVFLSAEKDIDKQLAAMGLAGDDFLTKPVEPQHLVASINNRIHRSMILRSLMVRDSLTGLLNHTAIKDQLDREVARANRQNSQCCFAMIDIDFFKKVNDTYGHPAGDRVIKSLSRMLKQRLRETDAVGRYGGEEFAVVLTDTDGATAVKILDSIRDDFSKIRYIADRTEFSATFSCGVADVAQFPNSISMGDAADMALYKAKHGGRNQVSLATIV